MAIKTKSTMATKMTQKQQCKQEEEDQQQQHQHQQKQNSNYSHRLHLHLGTTPFQLQTVAISMVVIIFGLLCTAICVSGQVDGYTAGVDYPAYESVPKGLSFKCRNRLPGYYADTETRCQVWHWCLHSGHQYSFICPNGTVFNQAVRVCDWWTNVNCPVAEQLYKNNDELYRTTEPNPEQNL
ncbi:uncharacterized protein LOC126761326 [Bactrocera neohumeralis]|uniref:uncharacterized protein LOC109579667 n=1 Tax=Bactrocera dorsalis TaxID=27457 RepID=A0A034WEP2_BACDO|nr:uncharacterized protein LOC126761326 [Bactrocera neohumeralis]